MLGYLLYEYKLKDINEDVINEFDQYLADYVYDKLFSEMSSNEQEIVLAFNENEPIKLEELSKKTSIDIKSLSVYRDRLIKKGIARSPKYGYLEHTLPRFYHYLRLK